MIPGHADNQDSDIRELLLTPLTQPIEQWHPDQGLVVGCACVTSSTGGSKTPCLFLSASSLPSGLASENAETAIELRHCRPLLLELSHHCCQVDSALGVTPRYLTCQFWHNNIQAQLRHAIFNMQHTGTFNMQRTGTYQHCATPPDLCEKILI